MAYAVRRSARARNDIREFFRYLRKEAGETIALKYRDALENDILRVIANNPYVFTWFYETGAPYRAKLFKLASTTYWIIYTIDDDSQTIELLRFWNTARQPGTHGLSS